MRTGEILELQGRQDGGLVIESHVQQIPYAPFLCTGIGIF